MLKDILNFYRMNSWIKSLGLCLLGLTAKEIVILSNPLLFVLGVVQACFLFSFMYSFHDLSDYISEKRGHFIGNLIKKSILSKKLAFVFSMVPLILSIVILISNFSLNYLIVYLTFIIAVILYAAPKIRLGDIPIVDVVFNILMFSLILLQSYFFVNDLINQKMLFFLIWTIFYIFSLEIIHQISHFKEDKRSTAKFLGLKKSMDLLKMSFLISATFGVFIFISSPSLMIYSLIMIIGSFIRFFYILRINQKADFGRLRNRLGGILEGSLYFILNILGL